MVIFKRILIIILKIYAKNCRIPHIGYIMWKSKILLNLTTQMQFLQSSAAEVSKGFRLSIIVFVYPGMRSTSWAARVTSTRQSMMNTTRPRTRADSFVDMRTGLDCIVYVDITLQVTAELCSRIDFESHPALPTTVTILRSNPLWTTKLPVLLLFVSAIFF